MLIPPNQAVQVDSVELLYEVCEALKGVNHENVKKRCVYNLTDTGSYRMITDS